MWVSSYVTPNITILVISLFFPKYPSAWTNVATLMEVYCSTSRFLILLVFNDYSYIQVYSTLLDAGLI